MSELGPWQLSEHFSLKEFTRSQMAEFAGIDNTPPLAVIKNLCETAAMLERVREALGGKPVTVTSGYRCLELNEKVGSRSTSDHTKGQAADVVCPSFGSPREIAQFLSSRVDSLRIGQLILEKVKGKEWVHLSVRVPEKVLNRVLTISDDGPVVGIHKGEN